MNSLLGDNKRTLRLIWVISIIIPLAVALMIYKPQLLKGLGDWVKVLPHVNAVINSTTSVLLVLAVFYIKNGNVNLHRKLMLTCFFLGLCFLVLYVIYHGASTHIVYGDIDRNGELDDRELSLVGSGRNIYLFVLLSHIFLSIGVLPVVLFAFFHALTDRIEAHKKVVKFAFPIWLYVSVTGVIVYLMISPYY